MACAPQPGASGSIFHLVETLLGLEPAAGAPQVASISHGPRLTLRGLHIGTWAVDVDKRPET